MDLRIIHVVLGKIDPEKESGLNGFVHQLAVHQFEMGYSVSVWSIANEVWVSQSAQVYSMSFFSDSVSKFKLDPNIRQGLQVLDSESTIFHIHGGFIPQFHSLSRLLVKLGFKYVFAPHHAYSEVNMENDMAGKKLYIELFERSLVENASALHFIHKSEIDTSTRFFGPVRYVLSPATEDEFDWFSISAELTMAYRSQLGLSRKLLKSFEGSGNL